MYARIEMSISSVIWNPPLKVNACKNQMRIVASVITVPAFLMNDQARSQVERSTLPTVGKWYAGSSITNGAESPENAFVFLSIMPETMIDATPMK